MNKTLLLLLTILLHLAAPAQGNRADSLQALLDQAREPLEQFRLSQRLVYTQILEGRPEAATPHIDRMFGIAAQQQNDSLQMLSYEALTTFYDFRNDARLVIEYGLKALHLAESRYPSARAGNYVAVGAGYVDLKNYPEALRYFRKALAEVAAGRSSYVYGGALVQLTIAFTEAGPVDSALHYAQRANEWYLAHPDVLNRRMISTCTGRIYEQLGNDALAESYYRNALDSTGVSRNYLDAEAAANFSAFLLRRQRLAEARLYGLQGLEVARSIGAKRPLLSSVASLQLVYKAMGRPDSAYHYATLQLAYHDSLFNQEKLHTVQALAFNEAIREKEAAAQAAEEALQRRHNLQYAAIALGLVALLTAFLLLSHTLLVSPRTIRFLGMLSLLIVFEFLNLLLHPWLGALTHHSPLWMLLFMVCLAALLVPLHHRLEHSITHLLVEKNKRIRLAAARRTLRELETENAAPEPPQS